MKPSIYDFNDDAAALKVAWEAYIKAEKKALREKLRAQGKSKEAILYAVIDLMNELGPQMDDALHTIAITKAQADAYAAAAAEFETDAAAANAEQPIAYPIKPGPKPDDVFPAKDGDPIAHLQETCHGYMPPTEFWGDLAVIKPV